MYPDLENAEYVLWLGTFPGSNGKSFQGISMRTVEALESGRCKMDVIDPVLSNGCVTPAQPGITWHPIKPATNAAFALGMIRWMFDNDAINTDFLALPNYQAALDAGFASYTDASHLVIIDEESPNKGKMMTPEDAGIQAPADEDPEKPAEHFVVIDAQSGEPALHDVSAHALIDFEGEVNGIKVRSALLFLKDEAMAKSVEEWAQICDFDPEQLANIAREFTSHGVKSSTVGLGATSSVNGLDTACAYDVLNGLVGSNQMVAGAMPRRNSPKTTADGLRYLLATIDGNPGVSPANATRISRSGIAWEKTDEYRQRVDAGETDPLPEMPWYSLIGPSDSQALFSIAAQYPYQAKALISWGTDTLQATPGAMREEIIDKLKDPAVLPLHIACDVVIGEHANLADYVIPDTNPYETFGVVTQEGYWAGKGDTVRWPTTEPKTGLTPDGRHMSFEAFLADVAQVCELPGWGDNAIADVDGTTWPLRDASDYFLKAIANLAYDDEPVADIDQEEIELQALDSLPESWKTAVSEQEWPKVLKVLSRGGRFWPIEIAQDGNRSAFAKPYRTDFYYEKRALAKACPSGLVHSGAMAWTEELLADGSSMADHYEAEFPFKACQHKPRFRSISMQSNSPMMRDLADTNHIELNAEDAKELGLVEGDEVVISSPSGVAARGTVTCRQGVANKTFGLEYGYGHIAFGAQDVEIDGVLTKGDPAIGAGTHLNAMLDPTVTHTFPVADPEAGSPGRNGGFYKIEKA